MPGIISACFQVAKAEECCNTGDLLITISMYSRNSDESFFERKRFIAGAEFLSAKIAIFPISREKQIFTSIYKEKKNFPFKISFPIYIELRRAPTNYPIFPDHYIFSLNNKRNWIVMQLFKSKKSGSPSHHCIAKIKSNLGRKTVRCLYRKRQIEKSCSFQRTCSCIPKFRLNRKLIA